MVKFTHLISKEGGNNKCYLKYIKLLTGLLLVMLDTFLPKEHSKRNCVLKGDSKGTWELGHSKGTWALRHSRHLGTWVLDHLVDSGTQRALGHSSTQGAWAFGHSGTRSVIGHLGTRDTRSTLFSRLRRTSKN